MGAVEARFRTLVLVSGGLDAGRRPEVANLNFAPRVRMRARARGVVEVVRANLGESIWTSALLAAAHAP